MFAMKLNVKTNVQRTQHAKDSILHRWHVKQILVVYFQQILREQMAEKKKENIAKERRVRNELRTNKE